MGHYPLLVIGADVDKQLEPYSAALKVPEYESDCSCLGLKAFSETQAKYSSMNDELYSKHDKLRDETAWKGMSENFVKKIEKLSQSHPLYGKPDPECTKCLGLGVYKSNVNKNIKWLRHDIGGRWRNTFILKNGQYAAQAIYSELDFDKIVLERTNSAKDVYQRAIDSFSSGFYDWRMIETSFGVKEYETEDDYVSRILRKNPIETFAVLKDGQWYARGSSGPWCTSKLHKGEQEWTDEFNEILKSVHPNALLTIVDCHL